MLSFDHMFSPYILKDIFIKAVMIVDHAIRLGQARYVRSSLQPSAPKRPFTFVNMYLFAQSILKGEGGSRGRDSHGRGAVKAPCKKKLMVVACKI